MSIEVYEVLEGRTVPVTPSGDTAPGTAPTPDAAAGSGSAVPGATPATPAGAGEPPASPAGPTAPAAGEAAGDTDDDDEPLRDDSEVNAERLNRRFARLTAARRKAERQVDAERQQHALELAQTRGQLEMVQRLLSGAAPALPDTPAQPTGPPQAEQYASHEDYVLAAARYGAQQEFQARDQQTAVARQQEGQRAFQVQLMEREATFKQAHPDFDQVVRTGLAGKISPVLQQALMLVPDGPAVAYALATQPDLVTRLNGMPPPLVLVELGRLSGPGGASVTPRALDTGHAGAPGSATSNGTAPAALPMPLTPLSGSSAGTPTGSYREGMSQEEFRRWRARTSELPEWKRHA